MKAKTRATPTFKNLIGQTILAQAWEVTVTVDKTQPSHSPKKVRGESTDLSLAQGNWLRQSTREVRVRTENTELTETSLNITRISIRSKKSSITTIRSYRAIICLLPTNKEILKTRKTRLMICRKYQYQTLMMTLMTGIFI